MIPELRILFEDIVDKHITLVAQTNGKVGTKIIISSCWVGVKIQMNISVSHIIGPVSL